ncbi:hypothetical protein P4S64_09490 [Vibrio sp. M60_M31a]
MNRAPHFGRLKPNVYFAQGFSGHGIAVTGLAGTLMAECVAATSERFAIFDKVPHMSFPERTFTPDPCTCSGYVLLSGSRLAVNIVPLKGFSCASTTEAPCNSYYAFGGVSASPLVSITF